MAYTTPPTFSVGQKPPAATLNTDSTCITELQTAYPFPTSLAAGSITAGTNVTVTRSGVTKQAGFVSGVIQLTPTGSFTTLTAAANGSCTRTTLCTLPAGWLPLDLAGSVEDAGAILYNTTAAATAWFCDISGGTGTLVVHSSAIPAATLTSTDPLWVVVLFAYVQVN